MSENYNDNDLEKLIFRDGLASGAIEPSEKFWNKAYEDIIHRENTANASSISRWKGAFFGIGTVALLLASYIIYMHSEVNDIKQQLTKIENTQQNTNQNTTDAAVEKPLNNSNVTSTGGENTQRTNEANAVSSSGAKSANTVIAKENKETSAHYNISPPHNNMLIIPTAVNITANGNVIIPDAKSGKPDINDGITDINNAPLSSVTNSKPGNRLTISGKSSTDSSAPSSTLPSPNKNNIPAPQPSSANITKAAAPNKNVDSSTIKTSILDTTSIVLIPKKPITLAGILSKTSVSAFYAPGVTEDFLKDKDNDPTHAITAHVLKTQQDGDGTYAVGFHLAYDISDKWTIQTGAYYSQYTYNINPTIIHAQQEENGQVGYSVTTSSGTVFLPNSEVPANLGDSIKVKGNSSRGYISIPLQIKYKFAIRRKFDFYVDAGFCMNIAIDRQTSIHWENTALQEGDLAIPSIYGLNSVQYSYNFGLGAEYLIGKGLSIYTEPFMNGSFTSINKNTPVITYPYFFGLAFGVTYHL